MDVEVDHYEVLGLPSGEEGAKLSDEEIRKAYKDMAIRLHPDKRRDKDADGPTVTANFIKLKSSYDILRDEKARRLFDDLLRVKREKAQRLGQQDFKRRKMRSDLEERERSAFAVDPTVKAQEEEARIYNQLQREIARVRSTQSKTRTSATPTPSKRDASGGVKAGGDSGLDKAKVLKVSWEKLGEDYSAQRLHEIFGEFGIVEDVVIKSNKKKKGSALVVMALKEAVVAATGIVLGDISNPLFVEPLQPASSPAVFSAEKNETDGPKLSNLVGAGYQNFENSVLEKMMKKAAQKQN